VTKEELEADLRRVNELLRATEKDRDMWKGIAGKTDQFNHALQTQLREAKREREEYKAQVQSVQNKQTAVAHSLRELLETHLI
jgi:hypothetical protein